MKHPRNYDKIATECFAFGLSVAAVYVGYLICQAVWYVAFTPAGQALTGAR